MKDRFLTASGAILSLIVFGLALWVLERQLSDFGASDILGALYRTSPAAVALSGLLTFASYVVLTGFDSLALRYVGLPVAYRRVALASFIAQAISHSTGFAALTGASIRYRLYSAAGVSAIDVARIVTFCALTFGLGATLLTALAAVFQTEHLSTVTHLPVLPVRIAGGLTLAGLAAYAAWCTVAKQPLRIGRIEFPPPSPRLTAAQTLLAVADLALAGAALYLLMPHHDSLTFTGFLGVFVTAILAGVLSHVPGGLGVFEGVILLLLPELPANETIGAAVLYRMLYNFIPLALAACLLGLYEILERTAWVAKVALGAGVVITDVAPRLFSVVAFVSGTFMLVSGATPAEVGRIGILSQYLPLLVVETAHVLASVVGVGLLVMGRGLYRRLEAAYFTAIGLLVAGVVLSILKGLDYEEALFLLVMLVVFVPTRAAFHRKASLLDERLTAAWSGATAALMIGTTWFTFFSYKHIPYYADIWLTFAYEEDAPRSMRAAVAIVAVGIIIVLVRVLRPRPDLPAPPGDQEMALARTIVFRSAAADASLALLGDKNFLFHPDGDAFVMYAIRGRSWIAYGNPVGPVGKWPDLVWAFAELCDRYSAWPVFYHVTAETMPLYLDLGLSFVKLGQEARVELGDFSLAGSARQELRYIHRRAIRDGASFEVLPAGASALVLDELRAISDAWLEAKGVREKRFSLGYFDPDYLAHFPLGIVRQQGRIVAFANVFTSSGHEEAAVDLMRYRPEVSYGLMDYLFIELLLWAKNDGYQWFNLGLAPLSGLAENALAPLWQKVGSFIYRYGEEFYNFQGLHRFKTKFNPTWRPKFLASPGGLTLPRVLADVTAVVAGGGRGAS
ncbi:MAG: bifunctional lysylphosphatidylglycerol flippase/synthetase MprF [Alphaproteobacteria bacterium]